VIRAEIGENAEASFWWKETRAPLPREFPAVQIPPDLAGLRLHTELHQFHDPDRLEVDATTPDNRKGMRRASRNLLGLGQCGAGRRGVEGDDSLFAQCHVRPFRPTRRPELEEELGGKATHGRSGLAWDSAPSNGSRLSCGRLARRRKSSGRQSVPARAQHSASLKAISARQLQALVRRQPGATLAPECASS